MTNNAASTQLTRDMGRVNVGRVKYYYYYYYYYEYMALAKKTRVAMLLFFEPA